MKKLLFGTSLSLIVAVSATLPDDASAKRRNKRQANQENTQSNDNSRQVVVITLPKQGSTKALAGGYTLDSVGTIKNSNNESVAVLTERGIFTNPAGVAFSKPMQLRLLGLMGVGLDFNTTQTAGNAVANPSTTTGASKPPTTAAQTANSSTSGGNSGTKIETASSTSKAPTLSGSKNSNSSTAPANTGGGSSNTSSTAQTSLGSKNGKSSTVATNSSTAPANTGGGSSNTSSTGSGTVATSNTTAVKVPAATPTKTVSSSKGNLLADSGEVLSTPGASKPATTMPAGTPTTNRTVVSAPTQEYLQRFGTCTNHSVDDIVNDMKLLSDQDAIGGAGAIYPGIASPGTYQSIVGMCEGRCDNFARNVNTPISWTWIWEGEGNQATNTRVEASHARGYYLSASRGVWVLAFDERPVGYAQGIATTTENRADLSLDNQQQTGEFSTSAKPIYPVKYELWGSKNIGHEAFKDARAWYFATDLRLIVDNPNLPDDRDKARYIVKIGADFMIEEPERSLTGTHHRYIVNGQPTNDMGVGYPNRVIDGFGGRYRLITNECQTFTAITMEGSAGGSNYPPPWGNYTQYNPYGHSPYILTEEEVRANPPIFITGTTKQ
ncbi:MAG: hypothetical protein ACOYNL_03400 [Rickettsiales bacterium]